MQIRAATMNDLEGVREIDGTVESLQYLHVERGGEGLGASWRLQQRRARSKIIEPNRLDDDAYFTLKQIVSGAEDGLAIAVEHEDAPVAAVIARPDAEAGTLRIIDLRVDFDYRRQG